MENSIYCEIDERTAERAHYCVHMSDYKPGSATAEYRAAVDAVAALAEARKEKISPFYHDKLDALLNSYARRLAAWTNDYNRNQASYPSQFISGAGNFNMRKHNAQMSREKTLWDEYKEIQTLKDKIKSVGTGAVDLADPHAREMLADQLDRLQKRLDTGKAMNAHYRKHKTMRGFPELSEDAARNMDETIKNAYTWAQAPMPSYELTSLRNKIKRVQDRINELAKRDELKTAQTKETSGVKFDGGEIVRNLDADRLQIIFDEKPNEETRAALKSNGFRWAPSCGAWQRQLTDNAERAARLALGLS